MTPLPARSRSSVVPDPKRIVLSRAVEISALAAALSQCSTKSLMVSNMHPMCGIKSAQSTMRVILSACRGMEAR